MCQKDGQYKYQKICQKKISKDMSENIPDKNIRRYTRKGCWKIYQNKIPGDISEKISIDMSENMSDKNVKRYVRGNINRNAR